MTSAIWQKVSIEQVSIICMSDRFSFDRSVGILNTAKCIETIERSFNHALKLQMGIRPLGKTG